MHVSGLEHCNRMCKQWDSGRGTLSSELARYRVNKSIRRLAKGHPPTDR